MNPASPILLLALLAPLAAAQEETEAPRSEGAASTLGERAAGDQSDPSAPRVGRKDNPRFQKRAGQDGTVDPDSAAAPLDEPVVVEPARPVAPIFSGTPRQGLREVERLARDGRGGEAAALAETLIARIRVEGGDERLLAELTYASGVARGMAGELLPAAESFRSASVLAGPGDLRADALYNSGTAHVEHAEVLYSQIPEVLAREMAKGGSMTGNADTTGPDTLPQARGQFLQARNILIERLRLDWRDEDARANLEFVQRRLDEIDRIESKRDESNSPKKSDQGKETEKTEEGESGDKGDAETEKDDENPGDIGSNTSDEENQTTDASDPTPGEGAKEGDQNPNPEANPEENADFEKEEQQAEGREDEDTESESGGQEAGEMSQEEVKMILDRVNELDELAKKLRAALYKTRRIPVDRDW